MPANTIKTRGRGWHKSMALVTEEQARQYRREKRAEVIKHQLFGKGAPA